MAKPKRSSRPRRRRTRFDVRDLNDPQRKAVLHGAGPLLVLAGAGSGKTRVITYRIARLIQDGVPPERILGVTFTNKAAREMRDRVESLVGEVGTEVHLSTFHSLGLTILREELRAAGLRRGFCIYDTSDQLSLVRELMHRVKVADRRLDVARVLSIIQETKRQGREEVEVRFDDDYELAAYELYPRYMRQMQAFNAVDFDDLLLRARAVLQKPGPRKRWSERFSYLMVDEYQDTSPEQLELLQALAGTARNVCAVGDDDQSIYAWRGADAGNILLFGQHFRGTHEVVLEQNYRSTNNILSAANAVIAHNEVRKKKRLWSAEGDGDPVKIVACSDAEDEAVFISKKVAELIHDGVPASDIAVLYRANAQSRLFEETFSFEHIPFKVVGGQSFHERKEVRDALAFLAVANNTWDELAIRRTINVPPRGVGPTSLERLVAFGEKTEKGLWGALGRAAEVPGLPDAARAGVADYHRIMRRASGQLRKAQPGQLAPIIRTLFDSLGLRDAILRADEATSVTDRRIDNLQEVVNAVARFERIHTRSQTPLADFLNTTALTSRTEDNDDEEQARVTLMTLHSAKGLEFPLVYLVGLEEGLLPHQRTLDLGEDLSEERRLCYVGMTRARQRLWITWAHLRMRYGKPQPRTPSRFLQEIEDSPGVVRRDRDAVVAGPEGDALAQSFFASMRDQLEMDEPEA